MKGGENMQVITASSPNFRQGRKGKKPIAIVNHITAGLMPGPLAWLRNPTAQASAHYLITKKGELFQLVIDEDTAWHAGIVNKPNWPYYDGTNPNYYTLGIEHEALAGEALTEVQYQATLWLHRQLLTRWGITADQDHIIGHYRIDSVNRKNDPGPGFPWARLFADLATSPQPDTDSLAVNIKVGNQIVRGLVLDHLTYGPVREIAELLGKQIQWDSTTNTVIILPLKLTIAYTPQVKIAFDDIIIPAVVQNNRALAPVRQLVEAMGHKVFWEGVTRTVTIV